jgi:DNA-binding NtrC family response regulator
MAAAAVKNGAFHYFQKPITERNTELFWTTVREAVRMNRMHKEVKRYRKENLIHKQLVYPPIIGESEGISEVRRNIRRVATVDMDVLITGETGAGKELVAREIHALSDRRDAVFLPVNCGEPSPGLLQSELFGHERGAFTGAVKRQIGVFEAVNGGVLFLDEISEASLELQLKLLRVLEHKEYKPVGKPTGQRTDFRLIACTNKSLEKQIGNGLFRRDLFFRLKVFEIKVPPLRERKDDIPLIADFFLKYFGAKFHREIKGFSEDACLAMASHDWPGNVRELQHAVEGAFIHCREDIVTAKDLFPDKCAHEYPGSFRLEDIEKFYIKAALEICGLNRTEASKILGVSRKTVIQKIKKYKLDEK